MCRKSALAKFVDASPNLTAAALSRQAEQLNMNLSSDRILTHRKHRAVEEEFAPAKQARDFAAIVRDKAVEQFDAGDLDLRFKDQVPGISAGLKAQAVIDKREQANKQQSRSDTLLALLAALRGEGQPAPLMLEDGNMIEGTATEVL